MNNVAKKSLFCLFLFSLIFISGCIGYKVLELEKPCNKNVIFEFQLNESQSLHTLALNPFWTNPPKGIKQGNLTVVLTEPTGEVQTENFGVKTNISGIGFFFGRNLFSITPKTGNYTVNVIESENSTIKCQKLILKVLKK